MIKFINKTCVYCIYIYIYICVCVCVCVKSTNLPFKVYVTWPKGFLILSHIQMLRTLSLQTVFKQVWQCEQLSHSTCNKVNYTRNHLLFYEAIINCYRCKYSKLKYIKILYISAQPSDCTGKVSNNTQYHLMFYEATRNCCRYIYTERKIDWNYICTHDIR